MSLSLTQSFALESLLHNYESLKNEYLLSKKATRNKIINAPKHRLTVNNKNSSTEAIRIFNRLSNELKVLANKKYNLKKD